MPDGPSASSRDAPATSLPGPTAKTSETVEASRQPDASAIAGVGALAEPAPIDESPDGDDGLSVFQKLNPDGPKLLDPREYDQRLPLDAIRPIYEPLVGSPDEVELDAGELVMGVSINGESRAYPISVLRFREIVNDELGGSPILVTW